MSVPSLAFGVFVSGVVTLGIKQLIEAYISAVTAYSLTFNSIPQMFYELLGYVRYEQVTTALSILANLLYVFVFIFFFLIYCYVSMRRRFNRDLKSMLQEIHEASEGDFNRIFSPVYDANLQALSSDVQQLMQRLTETMQEERKIEQTKNELITNVSHDLRTPLTSILGYLRYIEQDKYKDEVALRHYTGIAYEKSLQLEQLLNELFEYTRMQDSKFHLEMEAINLSEMLGQLIVQNEARFKESGMTYRDAILAEDVIVLADGEKIARVLDNLISNALHYGKQGKYVDVMLEDIQEKALIHITDYGEPIPTLDLPHIFDRFYRAEKSRARHTGGSGLGLAICKSIIEHHHGKISVESSQEKTCFTVELNKQTD